MRKSSAAICSKCCAAAKPKWRWPCLTGSTGVMIISEAADEDAPPATAVVDDALELDRCRVRASGTRVRVVVVVVGAATAPRGETRVSPVAATARLRRLVDTAVDVPFAADGVLPPNDDDDADVSMDSSVAATKPSLN